MASMLTAPDRRDVDALLLVDEGRRWLRFEGPDAVMIAREPGDVAPLVAEVEQQARARGCYAVGFLSYEAGAAFGLRVHPPHPDVPLAGFALFRRGRSASSPPSPGASAGIGALAPA